MGTFQVADRCVFQPGQAIDGRYTVRKTLGEGSFGVVYLVEDYQRTRYALKLLRLWEVPGEIRDELNGRFEREYKTGLIRCDNLVHALARGRVGGNPYIIMEFCPGGDLEALLGKGDPRNAQICRDILTGLSALHAQHIVHRDLKPENVLFKQDGKAALTDFGIVGDREHRMTVRNILGKPTQIFGTYAYMPPEQVGRTRGATVLPTTDIFSFGVLAYQLLTGELPFGALESHNDLAEYQIRGKKGEWSRSRLLRVADSQQWQRVIEGCLHPDYRQRLQTADEVMRLIPRQQAYRLPYQPQPLPAQRLRQSDSCVLRVARGEESGRVYDLGRLLESGQRVVTIGRQQGNDVCVKSSRSDFLSRFHCTMEYTGQYWLLRDGQLRRDTRQWTASLNGTFVNERKVPPGGYYLRSGDKIAIGDVILTFENY